MPTKLPPVPKRTSYEDIKENDLVMALFSDRIFSASDPDREPDDDAAVKIRLELDLLELDSLHNRS